MLKLHLFPIYQALALHLHLLLYPASSHFNSSSTCGIKLKLTSALAPDKRSPLITSGTLSRDPRKFARRECNFANATKFEKWRHQSTLFIERTYLWKFFVNATSRSQDIACLLFFQQILVFKLWLSLNVNTLFTYA